VLAVMLIRTAQREDALAIQMERGGLQGDFPSRKRLLDPHVRLNFGGLRGFPRAFGVLKEILEERGFPGQVNLRLCGLWRAPKFLEPSRWFREENETASTLVFQEGKAKLEEEAVEKGWHVHPSIFRVSCKKASSTFLPVFALELRTVHFLAAVSASKDAGISHS